MHNLCLAQAMNISCGCSACFSLAHALYQRRRRPPSAAGSFLGKCAVWGKNLFGFWLVLGPFLARITEGDRHLFLFTGNRSGEAKSQRRRLVASSGIDLWRCAARAARR